MLKQLFKLCTPAMIYAVLSLLGITLNVYEQKKITFRTMISCVIAFLSVLLINKQCTSNRRWLAWTLLAVPFILMYLNTNVEGFNDNNDNNDDNEKAKYKDDNYPKIFCNLSKGCHCETK